MGVSHMVETCLLSRISECFPDFNYISQKQQQIYSVGIHPRFMDRGANCVKRQKNKTREGQSGLMGSENDRSRTWC